MVQESQRAVALQSGTADMVINPASENLAKLKSAGYKIAQAAGPHVWWIGLNLKKAPFNNKYVRQALNYAIDRKAITEGVLYGTGTADAQPLAPMQLGYNPKVNPYTYDVKKAKALLAQAGFPNGFTTTLLVPTSGSGMQSPIQMGTAIQAYLGQIGIKVNIQQMDWGTFLGKIGSGAEKSNLDMWELSWMDTAVDPAYVLDPLLSSKAFPPGFNSGFYKNAAVDKLIDQGRSEPNTAKRGALYQKAMAMINEDAPWLFVDHAQQIVAYNKNVQGFLLDPVSPFILKLNGVNKN
jgi:peptide/nickel transport system substrate-binding protein